MLKNLVAALQIPDLRQRILNIFLYFGIFVLGLHIPVPGIDRAKMELIFSQGGAFYLMDIFSGGALRKYTIFAMGITPYINASIIMQLLTVAIPSLEALAKEGESGRRQIAKYTRWLTCALAFFQAIGMNTVLQRAGILEASLGQFFLIVLTLTAGTAFLMWLGEQITDNGIGNGVSLVIFASILARLPYEAINIGRLAYEGAVSWWNVVWMAIFWTLTVAAVVFITEGTRQIPIQHAKRIVGMRQIQGASTFLPLKVNSAGVIPIIFALSLLTIPLTIAQFVPPGNWLHKGLNILIRWLQPGLSGPGMVASLLYAGFIIAFTYFYTAVTINIPEMTENLKKWGSFIPGIRPGRPTQEYLDRVMTRITLAGAIFLAVIALLQYYAPALTRLPNTGFSLYGGTSLLIVVGVALETMRHIEAHLVMRNYEGFIKS